MRLLIVDDEPGIRVICERVLRPSGHTIVSAASGDEAVALLDQEWDIVLTDITMPGRINGLALCRQARARGSTDVLMMTGVPEIATAVEALRQGAYDYIIKPFSPDTLLLAVQRCVDKRLLSQELIREKALREELNKSYAALARMQKIKDTFGQFVTQEVAEWVLTQPEDGWTQGTRQVVTVMFTDVRGFTPFASQVPPEDVLEALNSIFPCIIEAVQKQGGIVNKFIGDGMLALFGAPLALREHAQAAVRAALQAQAAVETLAASRRQQHAVPLRIGIGINTGEVVAGCLGTRERTEYSVLGHAVNLAARLEQLAAPGQILLGPDTARRVHGAFVLHSIGPVRLDGIAEPVTVSDLRRVACARR